MSKPKWEDAPDWANWLAMDSSGAWCWYVGAPTMLNTLWMPGNEQNGSGDTYEWVVGSSGDPEGWCHSLEQRP